MKIKDMTREQKREYEKRRQEQKAAQSRAQELERHEREGRLREANAQLHSKALQFLDTTTTPLFVRLLMDGLGADARKVLGLYVALGRVDEEDAQALSGIPKRKFNAIDAALFNCNAIWPDIESCPEWMDVDGPHYMSVPAYLCQMGERRGYMVNPAVAKAILTAEESVQVLEESKR